MYPLTVERRTLDNAPSVVYRVQTRAGETRNFRLPSVERRQAHTDLEVRDDAPADEIHIRGHAAVFGRKSEDLGGFREVINPGAFKNILDEAPDVRALFNHDPSHVIARTKNKTLDLREDQLGLHYYAKAADTTQNRDLRTLIKRGDVDQSSFAFAMGPGSSERWEETEDGEIVRTVLRVSGLFDVSPVTYPAYEQTDASARQLANAEEEEPEARTAAVASTEPAEADQEAQKVAARDEFLRGAQRRLAIARAKTLELRDSRS